MPEGRSRGKSNSADFGCQHQRLSLTHTRTPHRDLGCAGTSGEVVAEQSPGEDDHAVGRVVHDHPSIAVDSGQLLMLYPVRGTADRFESQVGGPLCREQLWARRAPVNDSGDPFVLVGSFQHGNDRPTADQGAWTDHHHGKVADFGCTRSHEAKETKEGYCSNTQPCLYNPRNDLTRSFLELIAGRQASARARAKQAPVVAVFGKRWGGELRLPQKDGAGSYFVDWVLALLDANGKLKEFVAVEVQTIDTTGNYRNGREALLTPERTNPATTAGLNWENVNKRILPQLIYKGQVLQREALCRKGLFFVCPQPVYTRIMARLGGVGGLIRYALQPASITFLAYEHEEAGIIDGTTVPLKALPPHSTTVYKVQEAFNNVTLPDENVYKTAIEAALG